ncbi:hypothetical protein [Treponema sp.]|uniref:hypothetical protein n=1 Tax=Treponema sp. TaxID=166 RepID=UPI00298DB07C|nr:hypothetical protein [Treponema sp.]MCQ2240603.1 hypothetical protein [Treponema sp.]
MKTKNNNAFTVAIVSVYILTVVLYVASLFVEYKRGDEKASNRFNDITRDVSRISLANLPRSQKFYDEILANLGNVSDIAGIQLTYGNELIFSYPKDMKDLNNIKGYLVASRTTKVFASNGIPVNIHASIYKLKPSSIFYKGRIAFIVILAATIITAIHLILFVRNGTFPTEAENDDLDEDEIDYPDVSTYDLSPEETSEINNQLSSLSEKDMEESSAEPASEEKPIATDEEINSDIENMELEEKEEDVLAFLNEEKKDDVSSEEISETEAETSESTEEDAPKGLFCPETGFGWEEYMLTRLDSELLRSASSDQDLSLFSIRIPGIDWNSECGKNISKVILEKIKFNDLVFNYGEDGVSAIVQNQNTDQALVTAESLHDMLANIVKEAGTDLKISIGISSRSLRLISGSRLANESIEALNRAMADSDSPIIAFRVNPERYKDFLASESFQEKDRPVEKSEDEKFLESIPEPPADDQEETESDDLDDFGIEEELNLP